jgi:hypothetical protein
MKYIKKNIREFEVGVSAQFDGAGSDTGGDLSGIGLAEGQLMLDLTTDSATIAAFFKKIYQIRMNDLVAEGQISGTEIDEVDAGLDDLVDVSLHSLAIVHTLKCDFVERSLTGVTKNDASTNAPFTLTTRAKYESLCPKLNIAPLALTLCHYFCSVIQLAAPEKKSGTEGAYFMPTRKSRTATTLDAHIEALDDYSLAANVARILKCPLSPLPLKEICSVDVASTLSGLAFLYAWGFPGHDDATMYDNDADENKPVAYRQDLGMPLELYLIPLFRNQESVITPGMWDSQTPGAAKINIKYARKTNTSWTEYPDTSVGFDWINGVASNQSREMRGEWTPHLPGVKYIAAGFFSGESNWDWMCCQVLAVLADGSYPKTRALSNTLNDEPGVRMRDVGTLVTKLEVTDLPISLDIAHMSNLARIVNDMGVLL